MCTRTHPFLLLSNVIVLELFAGSGGLSRTVAAAGIPTLPPDEFESGGTDFRNRKSIEGLKKRIIAFYTQKLTDGWYSYRNAYREAAEAKGIEVDWGLIYYG